MADLVNTLASYVPKLITHRLATDPTPITAPLTERFPAAVLYADISGFSTMSEQLARCGPAGTDELTRQLNTYFGRLVDLVTVHGGDVVKFSGDGLLAFWPVMMSTGYTTTDVSHRHDWSRMRQALIIETYRATQCAVAVQTMLQNHQVAVQSPLTVRVSIGAGEMLVMHLGGVYKRWEFLVSGAPINQITILDRYTKPGQVSLSPEAWVLVQDRCHGERLLGGHVRLEAIREPLPLKPAMPIQLPDKSEVALRPYIPAAILSRLEAGQTGWLAELRRVTTLFVNLPDLTHTTPLVKAQAVIHHLQTALYRYEGSINKLGVDNKGVSVVAAMGLPPLAHQDDAVRGVKAALAMHSQLKQLGVRSAIGITTGDVFCGSVGNNVRREYTLVGDAVNVAAQLIETLNRTDLSELEPPILCDEATCLAAHNQISFRALRPLVILGKSRPVPIYHPAEALLKAERQKSAQPSESIVGRQAERSRLSHSLQTFCRAHSEGKVDPQIVVIEGSAGIGKSHLVNYFCRQGRQASVRCLVGAGSAIEKSTPYFAWRSIFSQLFRLDENPEGIVDGLEAQRLHTLDRLTEFFSSNEPGRNQAQPSSAASSHLAALLNAVLPLNLAESELTARMSGQVRAENTEDFLTSLLQIQADTEPTVLVLEDVHWLDSASWSLLQKVSQYVPSLLLVITARPPAEDAVVSAGWRGVVNPSLVAREAYYKFLKTTPHQFIRLETLSMKDTVALVCQRLHVDRLPQPVVTVILEKAEGHPFFSEELAYMLRETGLIKITGETCLLSHAGKQLFEQFSSDQLPDELNIPNTVEGVITSRIDRLKPSHRLALKVASVIGRIFAFRVIQDVHPVEADRPKLPTYLDKLERLELISMETPTPELSYFFKHSITHEVLYEQMTASQRRQLHTRVAQWYEQNYAGNLSPFYPLLAHHWGQAEVSSKTVDFLEKAGEQALREGAYQEATAFFIQAIKVDEIQYRGRTASPRSVAVSSEAQRALTAIQLRRARWERRLGEAYFGLGNLAKSRRHLEQAVVKMGWPVPRHRPGLMTSLLGQILQRVKPAGFLRGNTEAMREAARAYEQLGHIAYFDQDKVLGMTSILWGLNLAEAVGASPELARSYANMSIATGIIPFHNQAEIYSRRAREMAAELGDPAVLAWVLFITSVYDLGVGRLAEVEAVLQQAIQIFERLKDRRNLAECLSLLAMSAQFQGRFQESAEQYHSIYQAACQRGDLQAQVWGLVGRATSLWRLEHREEAKRLLQDALRLLPKTLDRAEAVRVHSLLALTHLRAGDNHLAQQAIERAGAHLATAPSAVKAFEGYANIAEVCITLLESSRATERRRSAEKAAQRASKALHTFARVFPIAKPRAWLWQGCFDWLKNNQEQAYRAWQTSLAEAKTLEMPYEQRLTHFEISRRLPLDDAMRGDLEQSF